MRYTLSTLRRFAGSILLVVTLLSLGGAVAGPWAHFRALARTDALALTDEREPLSESIPHDELGCPVCQALGVLGIAAHAPSPTLQTVEAASVAPAVFSRFTRPLLLTRLARAPPLG